MKYLEIKNATKEEDEEVAEAKVLIWKYVFGFVEMAVIKCAIELGIIDAIDRLGQQTLSELSDALGCSVDPLHRIMRFLVHQKFFKEVCATDGGARSYALTPLSRLLTRSEKENMVGLFLLESSPAMLAPWQHLSGCVRGDGLQPFEAAHGEDIWGYAAAHSEHSKLINDGMACDARISAPAVVSDCAELFDGVKTVVDVAGGDGTMMRVLVKAFPWIKGINFDAPHVVSVAPECSGVEHVGGDMFKAVPKADVAVIKWVLHDWNDEDCVQILKRCREAILDAGEKGKVIIIEAVISEEEEDEDNKFKYVGFMLDMVMMAHTTNGKERTQEEWGSILTKAGFTRFDVKCINAVQSAIVAYP